MTDGYRSYVVRVRRRGDMPDGIRIDVEDLIGGRRTALTGAAARNLADGLAAAVAESALAETAVDGAGAGAPIAGNAPRDRRAR